MEDVEAFSSFPIFKGIAPNRKDEDTGREEGADQVITDTRKVRNQFWHAGRERVTHGRPDDEGTAVERLGPSPLDARSASFFPIQNIVTETAFLAPTVNARAVDTRLCAWTGADWMPTQGGSTCRWRCRWIEYGRPVDKHVIAGRNATELCPRALRSR